MSAVLQEAINLLNNLPETDIIDLVEIMKKRKEEAEKKELEERQAAFRMIKNIAGKVVFEGDTKEELGKALREKYESLG